MKNTLKALFMFAALFTVTQARAAETQEVDKTNQICSCLEKGLDANCNPIKADSKSEKNGDGHTDK